MASKSVKSNAERFLITEDILMVELSADSDTSGAMVRVLLINPAMNLDRLGRFAGFEPMPCIGLAYIAGAIEHHAKQTDYHLEVLVMEMTCLLRRSPLNKSWMLVQSCSQT